MDTKEVTAKDKQRFSKATGVDASKCILVWTEEYRGLNKFQVLAGVSPSGTLYRLLGDCIELNDITTLAGEPPQLKELPCPMRLAKPMTS